MLSTKPEEIRRRELRAAKRANNEIKPLTTIFNGITYTERWLDIEGYGGIYKISDFGRLKSFYASINRHHGKLLKPRPDSDGYGIVELYKDGTSKPFKVHRLVAQYFLPNPENKPEVNHISKDANGKINKQDNRFISIEWATRKENEEHKNKNGLGKQGERHHAARLKEADIYYIRSSKECRRILAEKFNVKMQHITDIRTFKTWKHLPKK